jgi:tetratricopeptide (TPR) repeat protein
LRHSQTLRAARVLATWLALAQVAVAQAPSDPAAQSAESMARATTQDEDMTDQQARSHFRLGREYYQQGRFPDAAREFEVAYGLSGRAALLYNVYISYRDALDTPKAAAALRGYLAAVPDAPDRDNLSARLAALESQVAQSQADAEREAAQRKELERLTREAEAKRAEPVYSAPPAAAASRPWWPWLVVGAGVVATATGVTLGALASHDAAALREQCVTDPSDEGARAPLTVGKACAPTVDLEKRRDSIQTQALVGDVLWIGGAALTLTGLVLAVLLPANERTDSPPLTAACVPGSCQAALHLNF